MLFSLNSTLYIYVVKFIRPKSSVAQLTDCPVYIMMTEIRIHSRYQGENFTTGHVYITLNPSDRETSESLLLFALHCAQFTS